MTKLAPQFNWMLHERPFSDWLRLQPSDYQAPPWSNKWGENWEEKTMTTELRTSKRPDGSDMILFEDGHTILFPERFGSEPWSEKFLSDWKENWKKGIRTMATQLRTSKRPDGSGFGEVVSNGEQVVRIHWRGENGATPSDVIRLTITRMEDEQRGGPFADPKAAKALALMLQAERELRGDQATVDGVPVIGD